MTIIMENAIKKRTRLAPEKRKALILDMAAKVVIEEGVSAVSMERLGREAEVSKALVYNYFPNRNELLAALLYRDFEALKKENRRVAEIAKSFSEMVRLTIRSYLHHVRERGSLLRRLLSEPAVVALVQKVRKKDEETYTRYLVKQVQENCHLPLEIAIVVVDMCNGISEAASKYVYDEKMNFQLIEDLCVNMTMAALSSINQDFGEGEFAPSQAVTV